MTARLLLTEIYESKEVACCIKKLKPVHLQEDIKQHTFLQLFEKPEAEILELNDRGKLKAYIVKILHNTATYNRTAFTRAEGQERGREIPTDFNDAKPFDNYNSEGFQEKLAKKCERNVYELLKVETDYEEQKEFNESVACVASKMHWYKVQVLKEYAELGTYQAVSNKTKIPLTSIFKTVQEARKEIKAKL